MVILEDKYRYRVTINGRWECFDTLPEATHHLLEKWNKETIIGTISLFNDRNVITEDFFRKEEERTGKKVTKVKIGKEIEDERRED